MVPVGPGVRASGCFAKLWTEDLHRVLVDARGTPTSLLGRQGTLISASAPPARKSADLDTLLGGTHSKLRSGATYMSPPGDINASMFPGVSGPRSIPIALERAKVRAQVEVDLALTGDSFVQGQRMIGNFIVRVRKDPKKKDESTVLLADAKLRVIGFECLADDQHRHIFFQHTCRLDELSYSSEQIFEGAIEEGDAEGYRKGRPGLHVLPFEMELPAEVRGGNAKGAVEVHGGIAVRYVVLASIKVKDADTFKRSLAHFYRSCTIWPLLSFRLLVPAPRPLVSTAVGSLFLGCKHPCNKLKLTARIPRLWYLSGQRCYTHLRVENHTAGVVRSATVTLIRTTTVYKPCDGCQPLDERSYQMHTYSRAVAENHLELGKRGTKGHASAKGWWTGVGADQEMEFMHYIQLPPDALSISRSELLAVDYSLRVTVSASNTPGLTTDLSVVLPIRIASMVSVDPPPSFTIPNEALVINQYTKAFDTPHYGGKEMGTLPPYRTQPSSPELPGSRRFPKTKNLDLKVRATVFTTRAVNLPCAFHIDCDI
ncbi:hypothetical protein OF83DRAFT_1069868 [Amylostereum chailletii]|nr:hypothetical protein OF83DRAFT_1069868 [Amylostereum chailletii]